MQQHLPQNHSLAAVGPQCPSAWCCRLTTMYPSTASTSGLQLSAGNDDPISAASKQRWQRPGCTDCSHPQTVFQRCLRSHVQYANWPSRLCACTSNSAKIPPPEPESSRVDERQRPDAQAGRLSNAVIMPGSTPTQAMRWAGKRHATHTISVAGTHVLMASTKAPSWSTAPAYQNGAEITGPDGESLERLHAHMECVQRGQSHHTGSVRHSAVTLHHKSTGP